ncbi:MAG: patatin-like phospholipase family protein, partial [Anaerolineales bacterium]
GVHKMTIRTLVLSGGGGRGAFHAGVYRYLCQADKPSVDAAHQGAWTPQVVVGTSIGAVNGAAIAQGASPADLERFWLSLRERDMQGLPPSMGPLARVFINWFLKRSIGASLRRVPRGQALSPPADEAWPPVPGMPAWLADRLLGRWSNLLDTAPFYVTLRDRLGLDAAKLSQSDMTLLINATNVRTGAGVVFSNHELITPRTGLPRRDTRVGISLERIMASCSIPLMYPMTRDTDGSAYWDGALVANTPLGAAFDAVADYPIETPMEIVVVLLNPWWDDDANDAAPEHPEMPQDFAEAATWTLDWTMLASFRVSLKMLRAFNAIVAEQRAAGLPQRYREVSVVMVAPAQFLPVTRIIDYDEPASRELINLGYQAAQRAFRASFPA